MLHATPRSCPVGRYAPSATGRLHLGNISTAIAAHDDIRRRHGTFILRLEDADFPRNVAGAEQSVIEDLQWIGLTWDEGPDIGGVAGPYRQSEREDFYYEALRVLFAAGLIYPCECSRKDIQSDASAPHGPAGPLYPGTCRRDLSHAEFDKILTQHRSVPAGQHQQVSLRIRTDRLGVVEFHDEIHGTHRSRLEQEYGDFVILRRDGLWAYQFVCAVDDALMGVSRVVRGDDLLSSTARQVAIMDVLGFTAPMYRHVPLLLEADGRRMSKRDGSESLSALREQGYNPQEARAVIQQWRK